LNIRAGRIGLPTFLNSDNQDVGYSYPWVHPPMELYRQLAISHSDGVDGSYRFYAGDASDTIKALFGRSTNDYPSRSTTSRNIWGLFNTVEYGNSTFRVGYQARQTSTFSYTTKVEGPWEKDDDLSAGASYDPGDWFIISEWIKRTSSIKKQAMYISSGVRARAFTPYLTYSRDTAASFMPGFQQDARAVARARNAQSTVSLGTRWDFRKNVDLKLQYDRVRVSADSNGHLINVPSNVTLYGDTFHVLTVTLDFIF
jgi:predicted porin